MKILLSLSLLALLVFNTPRIFANGGDQRVVEGKYVVNLVRAPFTPRVNEKTSMLNSFVDLQENKLVSEDLVVKIRIARLGSDGSANREFLFEKSNLKVAGGILEFPYTFAGTGLHEIFIDFAFASNSQKIYESPDFLLDVLAGESQSGLERYRTYPNRRYY